jgi:pilus assembly protein Flp/PilA
MTRFIAGLRRFAAQEDAATMPEYALMVALVAVVCIIAVAALGGNASQKFQQLANAIGGI